MLGVSNVCILSVLTYPCPTVSSGRDRDSKATGLPKGTCSFSYYTCPGLRCDLIEKHGSEVLTLISEGHLSSVTRAEGRGLRQRLVVRMTLIEGQKLSLNYLRTLASGHVTDID